MMPQAATGATPTAELAVSGAATHRDRMRRRAFLAGAGAALLAGCSRDRLDTGSATPTGRTVPTSSAAVSPSAPAPPPEPTPGTAVEILARSTIPVLCFHQLRDHRPDDSAYARSITTPPAVFAAQLQALRDGGWTSVTGPALVDHLEFGTPLPERAMLLTFDDGSATHHSVGLPVLQQFGFVGTFFPMTVVLDKPDWLSAAQLRDLVGAGMTIGSHTWDHQRLDRLPGDQWATQLAEPAATLADIIGAPVDLLAYPYGAWSPEALEHVATAGYRAAFQLADDQDPAAPLLTVRRIMPPPTWDGATLLAHLDDDF